MNTEKRIGFLQEVLTEEEFHEIKSNPESFQESLKLYDEDYIDTVSVIAIQDKRFVIANSDKALLDETLMQTLEELVDVKTLVNPVFVELDSDGVLLVD